MYLDWFGITNYSVNTFLGLIALYLLLKAGNEVWLWTGFWTGVLWFWWMGVSFSNYKVGWLAPFALLGLGFVYSLLFFIGGKLAELFEQRLQLPSLLVKVAFLLLISYVHPLGFDWYKPELMFTNSYLGVEKWQFFLVLLAIALSLHKQRFYYLAIAFLAFHYAYFFPKETTINPLIELHGTYTHVDDKWNRDLQPKHIEDVFIAIEEAIVNKKRMIVFPESIFALYLNIEPDLLDILQAFSKDITIVLGGLYLEDNIPRNSTYIFKQGSYQIAHKVRLVPFGEGNPLPEFMGKIVNKIFFDAAPNYVASSDVTDYEVDSVIYRNAICFEATSEELYEGLPKNMIVISNNGWITPSIEPTQQKILLQYYSKKYGTTIYHSVNMSPSYIVVDGEIVRYVK